MIFVNYLEFYFKAWYYAASCLTLVVGGNMPEKITLGLVVVTDFWNLGKVVVLRKTSHWQLDGQYVAKNDPAESLRVTLLCEVENKEEDYEMVLLNAVRESLGEEFYECLAERKGLKEHLGLDSGIFTELWDGYNENPNALERKIIFGIFVSPMTVQKMKTNILDGSLVIEPAGFYFNWYYYVEPRFFGEGEAVKKAFEILKPAMGDVDELEDVVDGLTNGVGVYELQPD